MILCYHGVALQDEQQWNPTLYISPGTLERRLERLHRLGCRVLRLGEALEHLYRGDLLDNAVVLTFDDGFHDFLARALPLLHAADTPATVYLSTQRCEHNRPIVHLFVSYVLWKCRAAVLDGRGIPGLSGMYPLDTPAARERVLTDLQAHVSRERLSPTAKDDIARQIVERLGLDHEALCRAGFLTLMSPAEVGFVSQAGIDVEMHTHRHMTPTDPSEFAEEIRQNRQRIAWMTGRMPRHFCYPSGVYAPQYLPRLADESVLSATTCDPGLAASDTHPLLLPRFIDNEQVSEAEFEAWVTGAAAWLPHRTRRAHGLHA